MTNIFKSAAVVAGMTAMLTLSGHTVAWAQTTPCGYWSDGTWISTPCAAPAYQTGPSGPCGYWSEGVWVATPCAPRQERQAITGVIVGVDNNMLTVQTGPNRTISVNDGPAIDRMATGHIYTGRMITAYGYWDGDQFVATSIG